MSYVVGVEFSACDPHVSMETLCKDNPCLRKKLTGTILLDDQ